VPARRLLSEVPGARRVALTPAPSGGDGSAGRGAPGASGS